MRPSATDRKSEPVVTFAAGAAPAPAANPLLSAGPGGEWARRSQTQAIGPEAGPLSATELALVPRGLILPIAENLAPPRAAEIAPKVSVAAPEVRFGRVEKSWKSWLGRMFSRT